MARRGFVVQTEHALEAHDPPQLPLAFPRAQVVPNRQQTRKQKETHVPKQRGRHHIKVEHLIKQRNR